MTFEEGENFAKEHEMIFIETSAKSGQNINDVREIVLMFGG